jgi:hypothetical protein
MFHFTQDLDSTHPPENFECSRLFSADMPTNPKDHEKRAALVLDLEEKVAAVVKKLKERGLVSQYLRSFVVARINPLRWIKGEPPSRLRRS